ncbi:hypothetical protein KGD83_23460 [Nocardiopsis akebiae]|uniref:Lipoprotein n=1 Tax=Nocardiopsis akebiae TaxID=2831968 RepID=A0ABX8C401_9ACTN|nr:hypothetical protein [Nocardiopsis akebiae]QUX28184.1 hypothetical protein KGD83_23460 [Nocardiopsis akebiae]
MTNKPHMLALGALAFLGFPVTACAPEPGTVQAEATERDALPPLGADGQAPSEDLSLQEAAPFLEAQGYFPAEGDLNGYEVGHLPDDVGGTPYDLDHTALAAARGHVVPDLHEVERSWLADTVQVDYLIDDNDQVMPEREAVAVSALYVSVMRRDDLADADAYYELLGSTLEEEFPDSPARELPGGDGHYNGSTAVFCPEPGVIVWLSYVDDAYWEEVEASEDPTAEGDPEEVLRIVEGITPA